MPRPYDGPKCQSRGSAFAGPMADRKPAPTTLFLSVGAKTSFGVWAREKRDRQSADGPASAGALDPSRFATVSVQNGGRRRLQPQEDAVD